jgi:hypothetical protein
MRYTYHVITHSTNPPLDCFGSTPNKRGTLLYRKHERIVGFSLGRSAIMDYSMGRIPNLVTTGHYLDVGLNRELFLSLTHG